MGLFNGKRGAKHPSSCAVLRFASQILGPYRSAATWLNMTTACHGASAAAASASNLAGGRFTLAAPCTCLSTMRTIGNRTAKIYAHPQFLQRIQTTQDITPDVCRQVAGKRHLPPRTGPNEPHGREHHTASQTVHVHRLQLRLGMVNEAKMSIPVCQCKGSERYAFSHHLRMSEGWLRLRLCGS